MAATNTTTTTMTTRLTPEQAITALRGEYHAHDEDAGGDGWPGADAVDFISYLLERTTTHQPTDRGGPVDAACVLHLGVTRTTTGPVDLDAVHQALTGTAFTTDRDSFREWGEPVRGADPVLVTRVYPSDEDGNDIPTAEMIAGAVDDLETILPAGHRVVDYVVRTDQQDWSTGVVVLTRWDGWPRGWQFDTTHGATLDALGWPPHAGAPTPR